MHKKLLLTLLLASVSSADTGWKDMVNVTETDNSPKCQVGQLKFSPGSVTCHGQSATITTGSGGGGGSSGYAVEPGTVTFVLPQGIVASSGTFDHLYSTGAAAHVGYPEVWLNHRGTAGDTSARIMYSETDAIVPLEFRDTSGNFLMQLSNHGAFGGELEIGSLLFSNTSVSRIIVNDIDLNTLQDVNEAKTVMHTDIPGYGFEYHNNNATDVMVRFKAHSTQSANLVEFSDANPTLISFFSYDSSLTIGGAAGITSLYGISTTSATFSDHIVSTGTTPSVSSCGVSPIVQGTDNAGVITIGSGVSVTSCAISFAKSFINPPVCVVSDNSSVVSASISSVATSGVTFALSSTLGGGTLWYICIGEKG